MGNTATMEVAFLASGEKLTVLTADQFDGQTAKAVKQTLAAKIGVTRFRQRLFLEDGAREIPDDEILVSTVLKIHLVVLEFCPPDAEQNKQMFSACRRNDLVTLEQLLKQPLDPNGGIGWQPLHWAVQHGHIEPTRLLLEARAEIDAAGFLGVTALCLAAQEGHLDIVRFLIEVGANKDQRRTNDGSTPLHAAAVQGHLDIVRFLVEVGANKDQPRSDDGSTPLHVAAVLGRLEIVRFLVEVGANKDQRRTNDGSTPLHLAAEAGDYDVVRLLVEASSDPGKVTCSGETAWHLAVRNHHTRIAFVLAEFGANAP